MTSSDLGGILFSYELHLSLERLRMLPYYLDANQHLEQALEPLFSPLEPSTTRPIGLTRLVDARRLGRGLDSNVGRERYILIIKLV